MLMVINSVQKERPDLLRPAHPGSPVAAPLAIFVLCVTNGGGGKETTQNPVP